MVQMGVAVLAAAALAPLGSAKHVDVLATFVAAQGPGQSPAVSVSLVPTEPDIRVNEKPAPRLQLDPDQQVLVYEPRDAGKIELADPDQARYLDPEVPVRFDVELSEGVPAGSHLVGGKLVYFYCSKRKAWCRKGTERLELTVVVD
jgi:hypothetical protein